MADAFTPNKNIDQPVTGSYPNTWATPVNSNWSIIDTALGGVTKISVTGVAGGVYTLSTAQYTPPNIWFTGVLTANLTYAVPAGAGGVWTVFNNTSGAFTLTFASGGGGALVLTQGSRTLLVSDGTNVQYASTPLASANPSAQVGTTAVNGTASTYMTSDSAPAINLAMSPQWSGNHTFNGATGLHSTALFALMNIGSAGGIDAAVNGAYVRVPTQTTGDSSINSASTAFVQATLAASPALGGNPTAATQSTGNASTRIASTQFVANAVAATLAGNNTNGSFKIGGVLFNYGQGTTISSGSYMVINYTTAYSTAVWAVIPYPAGGDQNLWVNSGLSGLTNWTLNFGATNSGFAWISVGQ